MNRIIAVANQKGGVGKTTTIINLAAALGARDLKVLIVDIDPQGNAASGLDIDSSSILTSYDVLINEKPAHEATVQTRYKNVSLLPANQELSGAQIEMVNMIARESRLKKALEVVVNDYDYILIDTPPSLGLLTLNALCAAESVFIPIQCEFYALEGISQLLKTIKLVKQNLNPLLMIEGVCLTMFDSRTNLSKEVMENVVAHFKEKTYKTIIPRNVRLSEAPSHGQPISVYSPESVGATAYEKLADEFLEKNRQETASPV
ncbi:MAG: ParA family protein [Spirochaetia bacterium]|nr:ParA family protein [Spirochaetia bacterium]